MSRKPFFKDIIIFIKVKQAGLRLGLVACLLPVALLAACGDNGQTTSIAAGQATAQSTFTAGPRNQNSPEPVTSRPAGNTPANRPASPATGLKDDLSSDLPDLTRPMAEQALIRTFEDRQRRPVRLIYGRGAGRQGDYGWAHIYGKHILGIWYAGGTVTTFPKALNTRSPQEVVELIGLSLKDQNPDTEGNGRRSYVYAVPGTGRDVFTVVGGDGTIITAYPVRHGSKDDDS